MGPNNEDEGVDYEPEVFEIYKEKLKKLGGSE